MLVDALELTKQLVAIRTDAPLHTEAECTELLKTILTRHGFEVKIDEFAPGRTSLIAKYGSLDAERVLCFAGHHDTVPADKQKWKTDPFSPHLEGGRIYGRGSTDMKSGVAAFIVAAIQMKEKIDVNSALVLIIAGSEETGCQGSGNLVAQGLDLGNLVGMIVAEPTDCQVVTGHKGALWLRVHAQGVSAHGAMPHLGSNAIVKLLKAFEPISSLVKSLPSSQALGTCSINLGRIQGGTATNLVADSAWMEIDIRTVPEVSNETLLASICESVPADVQVEVMVDVDSVYTQADDLWVIGIQKRNQHLLNDQSIEPKFVHYYTDASMLKKVAKGAPIVILGPGNPNVMHATNEYCLVENIYRVVDIYKEIIAMSLVKN